MKLESVDILLVEDNPGDQRLVKEALKENGLQCNLYIAEDGVEALRFLRGEGRFEAVPRPDLILLDLNLPKLSGREILAEIKPEQSLKSIPVVVMSTSQSDDDIRRVYDLCGNCYLTKPMDLDEYVSLIGSVASFWFSVVKLPWRNGHGY